MKRKAILIESSNVKGQRDLPGARVDIENWKSFLQSDLGGAWEESEILLLNKPLFSDVDKSLKDHSDGYCFVAFSGHGCDGSVVLNDQFDSFSVSLLKPRGNQGTLIVDSCRGVTEAINFSFGAKQAFANEEGLAVAMNARQGRSVVFASGVELLEHQVRKSYGLTIKSRQMWENALKNRSTGIVEMLACSKGQAAGEDPTAGGYYTSLLLQSANLWEAAATAGQIHTTKDAHEYASSKLAEQQTPEYRPSWLNFPFAVRK